MESLSVFAVQFAYVLLLGLQSRHVRDSQYASAMGTSLALGLCGVWIQPLVIKAALLEPSATVLAAYVFAGPVAIAAAIWLHDWRVRDGG